MRTRSLTEDGEANVSWKEDVTFAGNRTDSSVSHYGGDLLQSTDRENLPLNVSQDQRLPTTNASDGRGRKAPRAVDVPLELLSTEELYTTEIVRAMFGPSVGAVVGDFSCLHKRNSGRLYLSTTALCYYSNLFGSETKVLLRLLEVFEVSRTKNSGILVKATNMSEYSFRSFKDRDKVYHAILRLRADTVNASPRWQRAMEFDTEAIDEPSSRSTVSPDRPFRTCSSSLLEAASSGAASTAKPFKKMKKKKKRIRSRSVDSVTESTDNRLRLSSEEWDTDFSGDDEQPQEERLVTDGTIATQETSKSIWSSLVDEPLKDSAIEKTHLSCSLDDFYKNFLATDARYSFGTFQRNIIGDLDLDISSWEKESDALTRTIKFRHPLKQKLGPSFAMMERQQTCYYLKDLGIFMKSDSYGKGFPAADAFHVEDTWLIEPVDGGVTMTVRFEVVYVKNTIFKRAIDANTNTEYSAMYGKYLKMVKSALGEKIETTKEDSNSIIETAIGPLMEATPPSPRRCLFFLSLLCAIAFMALIFHVTSLEGRVVLLETQLEQMREEMVALRIIDSLACK